MPQRPPSAPRVIAIVGPYQSGKTTLLEALLATTGATDQRGRVADGNAVGDRQAEARAHQMGVELNVARVTWLGDTYTFLDCPGSIEFAQDGLDALSVVDAAVVVCEPLPEKAVTLAPLLHDLDARAIPHVIFINRIDTTQTRVKDVLEALRAVSQRPLVLREVPIREHGEVRGFVDLVSERAWRFRPGRHSEPIDLPPTLATEERAAREQLIEALADFDDGLLEQVLEDVMPSRDELYSQLARDFEQDLLVPVLFGSAERNAGIWRLLKLLRHETPEPSVTARRLHIDPEGPGLAARVFKTEHVQHVGKLSIVRVWRGTLDSGSLAPNGGDEVRIGGLSSLTGHSREKVDAARVGDVVAIARADALRTGSWLGDQAEAPPWPPAMPPLFTRAVRATRRADEVKLLGALQALAEDDPSIRVEQKADTHELLLHGQGELHLKVVVERLVGRYNLEVETTRPAVPYQESIQAPVDQATRYKRQTGGHGQFADIKIRVRPLPRGEGFEFTESIVGGAVPKRFIPSVEAGARAGLARGPLGFPVVDVAFDLYDGQFHAVDSSDHAFRTCAGLALREALAKGRPVLLEPILVVRIAIPNDFTAGVQRVISTRRGQLLDFAARPGWSGWDLLTAQMPQAEIHDLIMDLWSLTMGVGTFTYAFDHMAELRERAADEVVAARRAELAGKE